MRRILVAATALGVTVAGAMVAANAWAEGGRPAPGYAPPIAWGKCANEALAARKAECGFLSVPQDYGRPGGAKIKLAVSRIKHTAADYQGVMLVNPGGPGGAGVTLSALGDYVPGGVGKSYDWIGFDPRGVGESQPALTCDAKYSGPNRPPYVPGTPAVEKAWLTRTAGYADACAKAGGALLDHMKTADNVRDIDMIRRALSADQINFYGFSYGTYLGQVYATMFPQRVRKMVLDGNVNPARVWYRANLDQNIAFEKSMKVYFAWVAKNNATYRLGTTGAAVEKRYYDLLAKVGTTPADKVIGPAELTDIFLQAGYYVFGWATVAEAFSAYAVKNDPAPLRKLFDEGNPQTAGADNGYAIYLAVQCTDAPWPASWKKWKKDNGKVHAKAPFETWGNAWFNAPCRTWGAKAGRPVEVTGAKAPPVLLISETLDAATPFEGSLEVRKRFPRAALIEGVGGTTHAGSLFGNKCVDDAVAAYLKNGALPKRVKANTSDLKCKPIEPPAATATAAEEKTTVEPLSRRDLQTRIAGR